jgi:uncharacterized protein YndB with AHSA1/START domain/DNA-binding transcriptional ArsR family regulator
LAAYGEQAAKRLHMDWSAEYRPMDAVFKALADPSRRELLDRLNERNGQNLRELCAGLGMARQSVTKHLAVLEVAGLVTTERRGRERLHHLNTAPIADIADRWIGRYHRRRAQALADLKHTLESQTMSETEFRYTTYIRTTPEQLWQAITDPVFTLQYWGAALHSDWRVGSPILWQAGPDGQARDLDQVVLESDPPRRLAYTWHEPSEDHAALFGWSADELARYREEPRAQVAFTIEPVGDTVRLTVLHDGFAPGSKMLQAVSGQLPPSLGWPVVLASLKSILETGEPLAVEVAPAGAGNQAG